MTNTNNQCQGCHKEFASRNAIFRHLVETNGACLDPSEYQDFCTFVLQKQQDYRNLQKVIVLYGYIPDDDANDDTNSTIVRNGEEAAQLLLQVMASFNKNDNDDDDKSEATSTSTTSSSSSINRSYGCTSRSTDIVAQEDGTAAVTEVLMTRLAPLTTMTVEEWVQAINAALQERLENNSVAEIRVFGRRNLSKSCKFNAEMDVSHRRIEYLLPVDFLLQEQQKQKQQVREDDDVDGVVTLEDFFCRFMSFTDGSHSKEEHSTETNTDIMNRRPNHESLVYCHGLKKIMQRLTTQIVELDTNDPTAVHEKERHAQKRHRLRYNKSVQRADTSQLHSHAASLLSQQQRQNDQGPNSACGENNNNNNNKSLNESNKKANKSNRSTKPKEPGKNLLRRRHYHNFSSKVMAHEFLAYRRLDRFYHRATLRFDHDGGAEKGVRTKYSNTEEDASQRPFLVLSLSGDLFLTGQVCRLVGLFIALVRGVIDKDIIDCLFDETYPHLVATPPAPTLGMYAASAFYVKWEGRLKAILTPRKCNNFQEGWNDAITLYSVYEWQTRVREHTAASWLKDGIDSDGRLIAEKKWTKEVLEPWAESARRQLEQYRSWKKSRETNGGKHNGDINDVVASNNVELQLPSPSTGMSPPIESVDPSVPPLYENVLYYLRQANASGLWPSTTPKRQLVMTSTLKQASEGESGAVSASLSAAYSKAENNKEARSSAYSFEQGEGGASGSFSVGAMPGDQCTQPKANSIFPDLMKAAFELERALCPDRASSTIAINRNAQFRPHTDSGAGSGQSTSLIVGLGTYSGGQLVVEGEQKDIRYKAVEFNGWKQRHWTMPFRGERYSLVWFTPRGCEGVRGIDLCK